MGTQSALISGWILTPRSYFLLASVRKTARPFNHQKVPLCSGVTFDQGNDSIVNVIFTLKVVNLMPLTFLDQCVETGEELLSGVI